MVRNIDTAFTTLLNRSASGRPEHASGVRSPEKFANKRAIWNCVQMGSKMGNKERGITPAPNDCIEIRGARQNNLKGIDIDLPLGKLTVITGPSGSGKSSLAFQTIYAEGQRRYVETFSPYMRQFLDRMDKPRVDDIRGIPPAIAIEQSNPVKTSRSTVGTMTEINDYLKLLWPRIAHAFCPSCGREIRPETAQSIAEQVFCHFERSREIPLRNRSVIPQGPSTPLRSARDDKKTAATILVTFWVAVPIRNGASEVFRFPSAAGIPARLDRQQGRACRRPESKN